jgi:hypothetical protein
MVAVVVRVRPAVPTGNYLTVGLVLGGAAVYTGVLLAVSGRIRSKARALAGV